VTHTVFSSSFSTKKLHSQKSYTLSKIQFTIGFESRHPERDNAPRLERLPMSDGKPTIMQLVNVHIRTTASPHAQGPRSLADQSGAWLPPSRGVLATWTGGQRGGTPAPRPDRASPPEERHPVYPQRFSWFESTPRNAPRLPIQTNNHATSEPHTHVMSNENKFPLKINSH